MADALYELPTEYLGLQREAREFAATVRDIAERASEADSIHAEMRAKLAESGLVSVMVPAEFGGRYPKIDSLAATVVREAFATVSGHLDSLFGMQGIGSHAISSGGNDSIRAEWLPKVGRLEAIAALALTEPGIGSDLKAISTKVESRNDEVILNGHKSFITNAGDADFYSVLAREGEGYSLVLIPAATPGVSVHKPHQIIAPHVLGDVLFENVRVPADHRLGESGKAFEQVLATLATFRVSVAGSAVGLASAALEEAAQHAAGRKQFGVSLARLGSVPASLATSWTEIEMARTFAYRAAAAATREPLANLHLSSMAKIGATEMAGRVVDRAVQTMGRFGLVRGNVIERLYREARPMRIYEGSTEVILDSLAKQLIKGLG